MTHFSLKRTLHTSLISAFNRACSDRNVVLVKSSEAPNSLSRLETSIRKITQACHRQKLVKKTNTETLSYISPVLLKPDWHFPEPASSVAAELSQLLNTEQEAKESPLFEVAYDTRGMLVFDVLYQGLLDWRQRLESWPTDDSLVLAAAERLLLSPQDRWQLQSAYEWCCRCSYYWQQQSRAWPYETACVSSDGSRLLCLLPPEGARLIHLMVKLCDDWEELSPQQLRRDSLALAAAAEALAEAFTLSELSQLKASPVGAWLGALRSLLEHLLLGRWAMSLVQSF